jgi:calcineurin-like phosphoesterase
MPDKVIALFIGDIIGRPGRRALKQHLPALERKFSPSLIIANAENAAGGIGITEKIAQELFESVDVLTSGNHIWDKKEALDILQQEPRLLRPANYPRQNPGKGVYVFTDDQGRKIGILNLQGRVFMDPIDCPFQVAIRELEELRGITPVIFVDFHAEGTAYITDIGMVGGYNSVIGIKKDQAMMRFLSSRPQRFEPSKDGTIFSCVCVEVDAKTGKALHIQRETLIENNEGRE